MRVCSSGAEGRLFGYLVDKIWVHSGPVDCHLTWKLTLRSDANDVSECLQVEAEPAQQPEEPVPALEWWDVRICQEGATYDAMADAWEAAGGQGDGSFAAASPLLTGKITNLVQHPVPIQPPAEMPPPPPRPLMLTKKVGVLARHAAASLQTGKRRLAAPTFQPGITLGSSCCTVKSAPPQRCSRAPVFSVAF